MPYTSRIIFKRDLDSDLTNYQKFADKFTLEMSNLRMSERVNQGQTFKKQPMSSISTFKVQTTSRSPSNTNSNYHSNFNNKITCRLCDEEHVWVRCTKFSSPQDRRNRVQRLGLCLLCLQKSHPMNECLSLTHS